MPYIHPDIVGEARKMDLLTYLRNYEPQELVPFVFFKNFELNGWHKEISFDEDI